MNGYSGSGNPTKPKVFIRKVGGSYWFETLEDDNGIDGYGIALNDSGNILYAVGSFRDTLVNGFTTITSSGSTDIYFLAIRSSSGAILWARRIGAAGTDEAYSVVVDRQDNVYFTGSFANTTNFNPVFGTYTLNPSAGNVFIEKLSRCTLPSINLINGPTLACHNTINTYSVPSVPGALQYTWTLPASWTGALDSNVINPLAKKTGSLGGTVQVTVGTTCGIITKSLGVVSDSVPLQPGAINGYTSVCNTGGDTLVYSVTAQNNVSSYNWTLPAGWTGSSSTNSITVVTDTTVGALTVTPQNGCGVGKPRVLTLQSISSVPAMPTANVMDTIICVTTNKTFSVNTVPTAVNYTWTLPAGFTDSSTTNSILIHPVSPGGVIKVTANNACGSSAPLVSPLMVYTAPSTLPVINANSPVCSGVQNSFTLSPAPVVPTNYKWCSSPSNCSNSTNPTYYYTGANSYTISVTYSNVCGTKTVTKSVIVTPLPTAATNITYVIPLCPNKAKTFSCSGATSASSYIWTYPADWSGPTTSSTNSISLTVGELSGNVTVKASNTCGSSAVYSKYVAAVGPPPTVSPISGPAIVCNDSTYTYSVGQSSQSVSYYWVLPSGWNALSSVLQNQVTVQPGPTGGVIKAQGSNGLCSAGPFQTLNVAVNCNNTTGIEISDEDIVSISPNPTSALIYINGNVALKKILVYNLTGEEVYVGNENNPTIDLSDKPKGIYFVHITTINDKKQVHKVVLQ